jgi:hypothetical protein
MDIDRSARSLELFAQPMDENLDGVGAQFLAEAIDRLLDITLREHPIESSKKQFQRGKFAATELQFGLSDFGNVL